LSAIGAPVARRYLGAERGDRYVESTRDVVGTSCSYTAGAMATVDYAKQIITGECESANRALQPLRFTRG